MSWCPWVSISIHHRNQTGKLIWTGMLHNDSMELNSVVTSRRGGLHNLNLKRDRRQKPILPRLKSVWDPCVEVCGQLNNPASIRPRSTTVVRVPDLCVNALVKMITMQAKKELPNVKQSLPSCRPRCNYGWRYGRDRYFTCVHW